MYFKSKKNAAEYDQQTAKYFIRMALALQTAMYKQYGRDDLAVEIEYSGLTESQHPAEDSVPDDNRPYIVITNTEREDEHTQGYRLNIDTVIVAFPSAIGKERGLDERWFVTAMSPECSSMRSVALANDTTSDRMLLRLATTVNALI